MSKSLRVTKYLLGLLIAMCFVMVTIGGFVRLSGSGLSIPQWPIFTVARETLPDGTVKESKSVIPPTTEEGWTILRDIYEKDVPARATGIAVPSFKREFMIEWSHRFFAALINIVFVTLLICIAFFRDVRGMIGKHALVGLVVMVIQVILGGLVVLLHQEARHIKIAIHLSVAFFFTGLMLWMLMRIMHPPAPQEERRGTNPLRPIAIGVFLLAYFQIFSGGLMAGSKAGFQFNQWPMMGDSLVPPGLRAQGMGLVDNFLANTIMIQFFHRWFAMVTTLAVLGLVFRSLTVKVSTPCRWFLRALFGVVILQVILGILTLVSGIHTHLALAHQAMGLVLLLNILLVVYEVTCHKVLAEEEQAAQLSGGRKEMLNA